MRIMKGTLAVAVVMLSAACSDSTAPTQSNSLSNAFASQLAGFSNTLNSFDAAGDSMAPWGPGDHEHGGFGGPDGRHHGPGGRGEHDGFGGPDVFGFGLMGGGLGDLFRGIGFGSSFGHGRHGDENFANNCTFDATSGRLTCAAETHDGLTINRSIAFATVSGTAQSTFDSLATNSINQRVSVTGTITRRDGATSTVTHNSDRTVSGLAAGSTQRTVNGTSAGSEATTGSDTAGTFTVARTMGDTVKNVVIPAPASTATTPPYPTAGTVIRSMKAVVTRAGATTTSTRREVITYDGSTTAKVEITQDGTMKSCTVALPHGRLTCS